MNINLHIERMIVDEAIVERGQRAALHAAVAAELTRLLSENSLPAPWLNGGAVPSLRGGAIQVGQPANPTHLGTQIGQRVYSAISGPANRASR